MKGRLILTITRGLDPRLRRSCRGSINPSCGLRESGCEAPAELCDAMSNHLRSRSVSGGEWYRMKKASVTQQVTEIYTTHYKCQIILAK